MFKKLLVALLLGIAVYPAISADKIKTYIPRHEAMAAAAKVTTKVYPDADTVLVHLLRQQQRRARVQESKQL